MILLIAVALLLFGCAFTTAPTTNTEYVYKPSIRGCPAILWRGDNAMFCQLPSGHFRAHEFQP